jgi:MinD superfamily P-loop ATPase
MIGRSIVICVTGGKGGTGKTLVSINLATMFNERNKNVLLIDGDVENPNTHLLLGAPINNGVSVPYFIPRIIEERCEKCGICAENCMPHALLHIKNSIPIPILNLCSSCKLCFKICPADAIEQDHKIIGKIYETKVDDISLFLGELKPSEARSAALVEFLIKKVQEKISKGEIDVDVIIIDTAPGAHCDVEKLIDVADFVIPVSEPTPFGRLDLYRIIELIELLKKQYRVIINRSTLEGFHHQFMMDIESHEIDVLGEIPLDEDIVNSYCQGKPLMSIKNNYNSNGKGYIAFTAIYNELVKWTNLH